MKRKVVYAQPPAKRLKTQGSFTLARSQGYGGKTTNFSRAPNLGFNDVHYNDSTVATDATTTPVTLALNSVAAGDTIITRDGNKILQKALSLRIQWNNEAVTQNNRVRILVVHDMNANNATVAMGGVLISADIGSFTNTATKSRFTILWDKVIVMNQTADGSATVLNKGFMKKYIKIPVPCQAAVYGDGTAQAPVTGGLTLYYVGDVVAGATDLDFSVNARLTFVG